MQVQKKDRYKLNGANAWKYIKTLSFDASRNLQGYCNIQKLRVVSKYDTETM